MTGLEVLVPLAPAAAATGVAAIAGRAVFNEWRRRQVKLAHVKEEVQQIEVAQQPRLPDGAVWVLQGAIPRPTDRATGQQMRLPATTMIVSDGTPGANRLLDTTIMHSRAALSEVFGSGLVVEFDSLSRERVEARLPEDVRDRIIFARSSAFQSGFNNPTPLEVEALVGKWGVVLEQAIDQVVRLHEERNHAPPGEILFYTSLGGHAFLGVFIVQELRKRLPETPIIVFVNLPKKETQRDYFELLKPRYDKAGVNAYIVSDQLEWDWETLDVVMSDLLLGLTAASVRSPTSPRINNVARNVTSLKRGGIACYEYCASEVVAHRLPANPAEPLIGYYVYRNQVQDELTNLIERVETGQSIVSLDMPVGEERRQTYDLVLSAVYPDDMLDVSDYLEASRTSADKNHIHLSRPHLHNRENYETIYSVWAPPIDPEHPRCRLSVIRLVPVTNAHEVVGEIVKVPSKRATRRSTRRSAGPHSNGVVVIANDLDRF